MRPQPRHPILHPADLEPRALQDVLQGLVVPQPQAGLGGRDEEAAPAGEGVVGAGDVSVLLTRMGASDASEMTFPCGDGSGRIAPLEPGMYAVSVALLNGDGLSLGTAPDEVVDVTLVDCDAVVGDACERHLAVSIDVP